MNELTKGAVQSSWEKLLPAQDQVARTFYAKLFELDATMKPLFKNDLEEQGKKLTQMITFAVRGLDKPGSILPGVKALGRRHSSYGVKDEDYDTVGEALIFTLEESLKEDFTAEVKTAWLEVYLLLSNTMKTAAAELEGRPLPLIESSSGKGMGPLMGGATLLAIASVIVGLL